MHHRPLYNHRYLTFTTHPRGFKNLFQRQPSGFESAGRGRPVFCECKLSEMGPRSERERCVYNWACWHSHMEPTLALTELPVADSCAQAVQKRCALELGTVEGSSKSQLYRACVLLASLPKNRTSLL